MSEEQSSKSARSLSKQIEIEAPVEAVWKALTDAEELTRWFPLEAKVTPGPDGSIWMSWRNEWQFSSRIEIWEPNKRLRLVDMRPESDEQSDTSSDREEERVPSVPTQVAMDYHLERKGNRTVLRLVHSGFSRDTEWDNLFEGTSRGWDYQFWSLKHYLENHRGRHRRTIYSRHFINRYSRENAWERLWSDQGFGSGLRVDNLTPSVDYAIQTLSGTRLQGTIRSVSPPVDFSATVVNLNHGIMRIQLEDLFGKRDVSISVSTYGVDEKIITELRTEIENILNQLFPDG